MSPDQSTTLAVLRTAAECENLARSGVPLMRFGTAAITLELPLEASVQARLQSELDRTLATCGCVASAVAMLAVLAPGLVGIWGFGLGESLSSNRWLLSAGVFVISALIALSVKFAILFGARRHLRESLLGLAALGRNAAGV